MLHQPIYTYLTYYRVNLWILSILFTFLCESEVKFNYMYIQVLNHVDP